MAALFVCSFAQAQQDTSRTLQEVFVTANKFPQKQNETGKVVTIITQDILAKSTGKTLGELLNQQAGITVSGAENPLGTNQDIYMRGAAPGKSLVLIDGIPAYDPSIISTAFDINNLSIDNIERIEIVRGAMSTLYGSDAIAGVINIITKKGGSKPFSLYGNAGAGSYHTDKEVLGVRGTAGRNTYNLEYTHVASNGISSAYDSTGKASFDNDGFFRHQLLGAFSHRFSDAVLWSVQGQAGRYKTGLDDGAFTDNRDYAVTTRNAQATTGIMYRYGSGQLHFNYNFNITERSYLDDSTLDVSAFTKFSRQLYTGRAHFAELYTNFRVNRFLELLAGVDYRYQNTDQYYFSVSSYGPYVSSLGSDSARMHQSSAYVSAFLHTAGGFHLEMGGRYNVHSRYGNNFTYTFNPAYVLNRRLKIFANVASAFKAPSLYQLFDGYSGNPTLQPETSVTYEGGAAFTSLDEKRFIRAVYFKRSISHGIDYNYATSHYFNNNSQNDHGFELEAAMHYSRFMINANYSYVTGSVNTLNYLFDAASYTYTVKGDTSYNNLFRRPKHTVNVTLGLNATRNWFISAHYRYVSGRNEYQYMAAPVKLEDYQTLDLYTEYRFGKKFRLYADFKNITNVQYFDILGYNSRRFNFMAGGSFSL